MNDAVQTGVNGNTTLPDSQSGESTVSTMPEVSATNVENTSTQATETSREDINTPAAQGEANANTSQTEVLKESTNPRTVNRFQELANRLRESESRPYMPQAYPGMVQDSTLQDELRIVKDTQKIMVEQQLFNDARQEVPELKDAQFENYVYATYKANQAKGEFVHPTEIAKDLKKLMAKQSSKIAEQIEQQVSVKSSGSVSSLGRSDTKVDIADKELETLRDQGIKGRDSAAFAEYLRRARESK